jgi:hypothetical protein
LSVPVPLATKMLAVLMVPRGDGDGDTGGDADGLGDGRADWLGEGGADFGGLAVGFFETPCCAPMIRWPTTS